MTVQEAELLLQRLGENWPKAELSVGKRLQYIGCISDFPYDLGEMVVTQALTTCKWFPEIAEFRAIAGELYQRALKRPSADEAWAEFKRAVHRYGYQGSPEWSHPAVARCAGVLGFHDFCLSDSSAEPSWRARFIEVYEGQGTREVRDVQMLPSVHQRLAQLADSMTAWRRGIEAPREPAPELVAASDGCGEV